MNFETRPDEANKKEQGWKSSEKYEIDERTKINNYPHISMDKPLFIS